MRDCDRVSLWRAGRDKAIRLGRRTRCGEGSRIDGVSIAGTRAVWLHRTGSIRPAWTLWTATAARAAPRLLARTTTPRLIVLGPGNLDRRREWGEGRGDVLPYAVGADVVVLRGDGSVSYRWAAPAPVTALGSAVGLLLVAVEDGRIFLLEDGTLVRTYPGTVAASRVFLGSAGVVSQRGSLVDVQGGDCDRTMPLRAGERLAAAGGGRYAIVRRGRVALIPGCRGSAVFTTTATVVALDNYRLTTASGRRVTTRLVE